MSWVCHRGSHYMPETLHLWGTLARYSYHLNSPLYNIKGWVEVVCAGVAVLLWAPHPVFKGVHRHPSEETHFRHLHLWSYSFSQYPELVTVGEGKNIDQLVNWELYFHPQLSFHHSRLILCLHRCLDRKNLSFSLFTPLHSTPLSPHSWTCYKILKLLILGHQLVDFHREALNA